MVVHSSPPPLSLPSLFFLLLTFIHLCNTQPIIQTTANTQYLKLPLIRRNPLTTPSQALSADTRRFFALQRRNRPELPVTSGSSFGTGEYFVEVRLGTPPQRLLLVADTGSDLLWVTCSSCINCSAYPPHSAFFAHHSSTFYPYHCFNSACQFVPRPHLHCNHTVGHSPCRYVYSYADGSTTAGVFSKETTTFHTTTGEEVKSDGLAFGCSFNVSGPSGNGPPGLKGAYGVLGLGHGPISFTSQLGPQFGNKFSYCLLDYNIDPTPTSYLLIGGTQKGVVEGKTTMSYTPIKLNAVLSPPTFYYIGIESVYVDDIKLLIRPSVWEIDESGNGGTIVDSGTTLTILVEPAYRQIMTAFKHSVNLPRADKPSQPFELCVNVSGESRPKFPRFSFELGGGSVFAPPPQNYFIDTAQNVKCLALMPDMSGSGMSVIGNIMQQGFLFEFDMDRLRLGFTRHGCAIS